MCNLKTTIVPVVVGALGMIKKGTYNLTLTKYPTAIRNTKIVFPVQLVALGESTQSM